MKNCISQCYHKGKRVKHPKTKNIVTNLYDPFCLVEPYTDVFGEVKYTAKCPEPDISEKKDIFETLSQIEFNPEQFLSNYYNIHSLNDAFLWYSKNLSIAYRTLERIMDCALKVYGIEELYNKAISDDIIDYTKHIIFYYWLDDFIIELPIKIKKETIESKLNIRELLINYITHYRENWDKKLNYFRKLKRFSYNFIKRTFS